eukprot:Amastigsp_a508717_204.p2 type:complete len:184 gc:universal Amastigsp_a508717_204:666-115(-)
MVCRQPGERHGGCAQQSRRVPRRHSVGCCGRVERVVVEHERERKLHLCDHQCRQRARAHRRLWHRPHCVDADCLAGLLCVAVPAVVPGPRRAAQLQRLCSVCRVDEAVPQALRLQHHDLRRDVQPELPAGRRQPRLVVVHHLVHGRPHLVQLAGLVVVGQHHDHDVVDVVVHLVALELWHQRL